MEASLITCVILTYNKFKYIYSALKSVMIQNYPSIELIVSDDGSEKFPRQDIKKFIEKYRSENLKKVLIIRNEVNLGTVKNFNNAILHSKGEYIIALASDDAFYEDCTIWKIVCRFQKTKANILCCRRINCQNGNKGNILPNKHYISYLKKLDTPLKQYKAILTKRIYSAFCGASMYYDRNFLINRGLFDEKYTLLEDLSIVLQSTRQGEKIEIADDIISIYYRSDEGVSSIKNRNYLLENDDLKAFYYEIEPFYESYTIMEKRLSKFKFMIYPEYKSVSFLRKIKFVIKYIDMIFVSKFYKFYDRFC